MSEEYQRGPGRRRAAPTPAPCPRPDCRCPHQPPCVAGWVDEEIPKTDGAGHPLINPATGGPVLHRQTKPCPRCRPQHSAALDNPMLTRGQQMAKVRRLEKP